MCQPLRAESDSRTAQIKKTEQMPKTLREINNKYAKHIVMDRQPHCNLVLCLIERLTWASLLIQK